MQNTSLLKNKKPANASFNNLRKYRNDLYIEIQPVLFDYLLPISRPDLLVVTRMIWKHDRYRIPDLIPYLVRPALPRKLIAVLPENLLRLPHSRAFADGLAKTQKNKRRIVFPPQPQLLKPCRQLQIFHPARLTCIGVGVLRYAIAMGYRVVKRHKTKIICIFHICYLPKKII
jgi:hypothetical protein